MRCTKLLSALSIASYAAAECFESGLDWDDQDAAAAIVLAACRQTLSGTYGPESTFNGQRGSCVNTSNGKIDMIIRHITEGDRDLTEAECYDGLQKEVYGCGKGGETSYDNWAYK